MTAFSARALAIFFLLPALHIVVSVAFPMQPNATTEVPLNEDGYQQVVAMRSDDDMKLFIRRVLAQLGMEVADEAELSGFTPHYSGILAVQDYDRLEKELRTVPWVRRSAPQVTPVPPESQVRPGVPKEWFDELAADLSPADDMAGEVGSPAHAEAKSPRAPPAAASDWSKKSKRRPGASASPRRARASKKAASVLSHSSASSRTAPAKERHGARHHKGAPSAAPVIPRANVSNSTAELGGNTGIAPSHRELSPDKARGPRRHQPLANSAARGHTARDSAHAIHVNTAEESAPSPLSQLRGRKRRSSNIHEEDAPAMVRASPTQHAKSDLARIVDKLLAESPPYESGYLQADDALRMGGLSFLELQSQSGGTAGPAAAAAATPAKQPVPTTQTLPAVGEVLLPASETLHEFSSDTNEIRRQVEDRQKRLKEKMVMAKHRFEAKLLNYKDRHTNLTSVNRELRNSIRVVNETNAALIASASATQRSIHILQVTIMSLRERVLQAQGFLDDSLNVTDVTASAEVQVLVSTTPEPTLESFLSKARHDLGVPMSSTPAPQDATAHRHAMALLQSRDDRLDFNLDLGETTATPKNAEKMTSLLLESLEQLEKAEINAYSQLKTGYQSSKEKWVAKIKLLIEEQAELQRQSDAATMQADEIQKAKQLVDGTYFLILHKLEGFTAFLDHLDDAAKKTVKQAKMHAKLL